MSEENTCVDCGSNDVEDVEALTEDHPDYMGKRPNGECVHEFKCKHCNCYWFE